MDLGLDRFGAQLDKLGKVPRAYRLAMLPVIAVLVGAAYAYFLYLPKASELEKLRSEELQLQRRLNEVRAVAENMGKFEEEIATLERKLKIALRQLPDSKELPVLLTDVNTLGKTSGLEIRAFRPAEETKRDFYAEVPIQVEFVGRFHDLARFFDQIARLPRIVNVSKLDIKIEDETTLDTVLKVSGEAVTFRFLEESEQAPPATEAAPGKGGKGRAAPAAKAGRGRRS
jgi:type IV pilus assembly protein PilO